MSDSMKHKEEVPETSIRTMNDNQNKDIEKKKSEVEVNDKEENDEIVEVGKTKESYEKQDLIETKEKEENAEKESKLKTEDKEDSDEKHILIEIDEKEDSDKNESLIETDEKAESDETPSMLETEQKEDSDADHSILETEEKEESEENHSILEKEDSDEDITANESFILNASSLISEDSIEEEEKESPNDLTLSSKRSRKKVERFVQEIENKDKEEVIEMKGNGVMLGSIIYIESMISKTLVDDLKTLHRIVFKRLGSHSQVKRNLKKFCGLSFNKDTDSKEYERKKKMLEKLTIAELKKNMAILGLEKKGTKPELVERILEFIICPVDKGQSLPTKKSKTKKPKPKKKKVEKAQKSKGKEKKVEAEPESASNSDSSSEEEPKSIKKKTAKKVTQQANKKTPTKKRKAEQDLGKSPAVKRKKVSTPTGKKVQAEPESDSDSDSSMEEEPKPIKKKTPKKVAQPANKNTPAKKRKAEQDLGKSPAVKRKKVNAPTDAQIIVLLKKILNTANLEEVTMKKVCQQVYDSYPNHDLLSRKDFIKENVKLLLS